MLTVRGAKTGQSRRIPLMRVDRNGRYAAVTSRGGSARTTAWYYNLKRTQMCSYKIWRPPVTSRLASLSVVSERSGGIAPCMRSSPMRITRRRQADSSLSS